MGVWDFLLANGNGFRIGDPGSSQSGYGALSLRLRGARRGVAVVVLRWWRALAWEDRIALASEATDRPTDRTGGGHGRATGGPADRRTVGPSDRRRSGALAGLACGPCAGRDPRPFRKPHGFKERGSVPAPTIYMYHWTLNMQGPVARILSCSLVSAPAENRASCSCMFRAPCYMYCVRRRSYPSDADAPEGARAPERRQAKV